MYVDLGIYAYKKIPLPSLKCGEAGAPNPVPLGDAQKRRVFSKRLENGWRTLPFFYDWKRMKYAPQYPKQKEEIQNVDRDTHA